MESISFALAGPLDKPMDVRLERLKGTYTFEVICEARWRLPRSEPTAPGHLVVSPRSVCSGGDRWPAA